jgi:hypothetical protein
MLQLQIGLQATHEEQKDGRAQSEHYSYVWPAYKRSVYCQTLKSLFTYVFIYVYVYLYWIHKETDKI